MASFEETLKRLSDFARSDEPIESSAINKIMNSYFARFEGNIALERDKIANAFADMFGRRTDRFDAMYRKMKRLD